jgi:MvdD-like protein with pre-ATP grasp domain
MKKTVLLLSQQDDAHIAPVKEALERLGANAVCCDLADFPEHLELTARLGDASSWSGQMVLSGQDQAWRVQDIESVWWRRPQSYRAPGGYSSAVRELLDQEAYRGFLGLLLGSPGVHHPFWVSDPNAIRRAEFKPAQLATAQHLGLRVPRTLLTNSPAAVRDFYEECDGRIITKAVWRGVLDPSGAYVAGQPRFVYTSEVKEEHLALLDGVRATAHVFQERVDKALELRVVVIGRQIFAVEIYSQLAEASKLDWRQSYKDIRYGVHSLPQALEATLLQLLRTFNIQYASMDLIITPTGEYVWLELNPNGQFLWLEPPTGLPMVEAMAHVLFEPKEYGLW